MVATGSATSLSHFPSWSGRKAYMSSRSVPLGRWRAVASIKALLKITWLGGLKARAFLSLVKQVHEQLVSVNQDKSTETASLISDG